MKMKLALVLIPLFGSVISFGQSDSNEPSQIGKRQIGYSAQSAEEPAPSAEEIKELAVKRGGADPGGGDAAALRSQEIVDLIGIQSTTEDKFSSTKASIKRQIKNVLAMAYIYPLPGAVGALLKKLVDEGLLQDVDESKYLLSHFCHENGVEKSAHTIKVDRRANPKLPPPDICINVRKMGMENAKENEIVGVLVHEHLRHFNEEDTTPLKIHPTTVAIAKNYWLLDPSFGSVIAIEDEVVLKKQTSSSGHAQFKFLGKDISKPDFNVSNLQGDCNQDMYSILFQVEPWRAEHMLGSRCTSEGICWSRHIPEKYPFFNHRPFKIGQPLNKRAIFGSFAYEEWSSFLFGKSYKRAQNCQADMSLTYDKKQIFQGQVEIGHHDANATTIEVVTGNYYLK